MIGIAVVIVDGEPRHCCYRTDDGVHRVRIGCAHLQPRSAIAHSDDLEAASRVGLDQKPDSLSGDPSPRALRETPARTSDASLPLPASPRR